MTKNSKIVTPVEQMITEQHSEITVDTVPLVVNEKASELDSKSNTKDDKKVKNTK